MPSYSIISDVHSNLEALTSVLTKAVEEKTECLLFLGDVTGYGPNPNECIDLLQSKAKILLAGNHDRAVIGLTSTTSFNPYAKVAVEWTINELDPVNFEFLKRLPITKDLQNENIFLVHSTPKEPEEWHYLHSETDARLNFNYFDQQMCFLGHSHVPFIVERFPKGTIRFHYDRVKMEKKNRYIVNVGSVGQPRDGNPDASYALLKDNTMEIKRVPYDIVSTQKKMKQAGLPDFLIERLSKGR